VSSLINSKIKSAAAKRSNAANSIIKAVGVLVGSGADSVKEAAKGSKRSDATGSTHDQMSDNFFLVSHYILMATCFQVLQ
jgi:hypothetical protein